MKKCCICKQYKEENEFYKDKTRSSGLSSRCIECCSSRKRNRPDRKEYMKKYIQEYNTKEENQVKILAHKLVTKSLKTGTLIKKPCEICGENADAHHDNYDEPLNVRWLCRKHHQKYHASIKQDLI